MKTADFPFYEYPKMESVCCLVRPRVTPYHEDCLRWFIYLDRHAALRTG